MAEYTNLVRAPPLSGGPITFSCILHSTKLMSNDERASWHNQSLLVYHLLGEYILSLMHTTNFTQQVFYFLIFTPLLLLLESKNSHTSALFILAITLLSFLVSSVQQKMPLPAHKDDFFRKLWAKLPDTKSMVQISSYCDISSQARELNSDWLVSSPVTPIFQ